MSERRGRVKELFDAALALDRSERHAYLANVCNDPELREAVESLLAAHESGFLSGREELTSDRELVAKTVQVGHTLSHYQIKEALGRGGMGEVFLASDTKLAREVALKVLPPELAASEERRARFEREAKAVASLNHPGIVQVYSIEQDRGVHFITLELVRGDTLRESIAPNGMSMKDFFRIAIAVADALSAAHEAGVIHRDLKPDNVMVSQDGRVKVLDFGLAKFRQEGAAPLGSAFPTRSATGEGRVLGTAAYMSPEQAEGRAVDARSDIFSLGVLLYEMATGVRPFKGDSPASTISAILRDTPDSASDVNPSVPFLLARILRRCLAKDPEERFQTAKGLRVELYELKQDLDSGSLPELSSASGVPGVAPRGTRKSLWPALAAGFALIAIGSWFLARTPSTAPAIPPTYTQITFVGDASMPAISPDGAFVAYVTDTEERDAQRVFVHDLLGKSSLEVFAGNRVESLRWSPDGSQLLFLASGDAYLVSRLGGAPRRLPGYTTLSWAPDGSRYASVLTAVKELFVTEVLTSETSSIPIEGDFAFVLEVDWSPNGDDLLFSTAEEDGRNAIWTVASDGSRQIKVLEEQTPLRSPRWSPNGDVIYFLRIEDQSNDLWRVASDGSNDPSLVLSGLQAGSYFTLSGDGKHLLYTRESGWSNLHLMSTTDGRDWTSEQRTTGTLYHSQPAVSPDGTRIVFSRGDGQKSNIFVMPVDGGPSEQLTFFESRNESPVWSPDGETVAFGSTEGGGSRVWRVPASGGPPRALPNTATSPDGMSLAWAPGTHILYHKPGNRNYGMLDPHSGDERPMIEDDSVGWVFDPRPAPDGRRVALMWNRDEARGLWILSPGRRYPLSGELRVAFTTQSQDATGHRGKEVRLRAYVRADVTPPSRAQLLLRSHAANGETSYLDSMRERPVQSSSWGNYELLGEVPEDADTIAFGGFLNGAGQAWFDDFELSVRGEGEDWIEVAIENPGFEKADDESWRTTRGRLRPAPAGDLPGFSYRLSSEAPYQGENALLIEGTSTGLQEANLYPVGWSPDGQWLYAIDEDRNAMVKIRVTDGEAVAWSPFPLDPGQEAYSVAMDPSNERFVVEVGETSSDVWLVENFDSQVRP